VLYPLFLHNLSLSMEDAHLSMDPYPPCASTPSHAEPHIGPPGFELTTGPNPSEPPPPRPPSPGTSVAQPAGLTSPQESNPKAARQPSPAASHRQPADPTPQQRGASGSSHLPKLAEQSSPQKSGAIPATVPAKLPAASPACAANDESSAGSRKQSSERIDPQKAAALIPAVQTEPKKGSERACKEGGNGEGEGQQRVAAQPAEDTLSVGGDARRSAMRREVRREDRTRERGGDSSSFATQSLQFVGLVCGKGRFWQVGYVLV